ncbi:MAG TPA: ABC transporter permease [Gemmatimonadales bacterium]|nr:ABC transporter permease [Gemmatimonadales bacterium]
MRSWLVRRIAQAVVTFAIAVVLMFVLMRLAPGDPIGRLQDDRAMSQAEVARLRDLYDLDQPVWRQFLTFVQGVLQADLGTSIEHGLPVTSMLAARLGPTLLLGGAAILLNFTVGLWLGVRQAVRRGRREDRVLTVLSLAGYATPSFWLGLVLAWLVGIKLGWLPVAGMKNPLLSPGDPWIVRALDIAAHLVLPALTMSIVTIAGTMRYQRSAMLEVLRLPYIWTARAKGLPERAVIWRHAWRNALFPVITLFGLWLPLLVTGSVFVEMVFAWPGLGSLAAHAASSRDYPMVMGASLLAAGVVVTASLLTDIAYALLDPRVRHS